MIKNFNELVENTASKYKEARKNALTILDSVLEKMNGYNIIKSSVRIAGDGIVVRNKRFNLLPYKSIFLIGFGKASAAMAKAMEEIIPFDDGIVISPEKVELKRIKLYKGSHPFPTEKNMEATEKIIEMLQEADEDDLIISLISGGGSSMLCKPRISLGAMVEVTKELMEKGCTIEELNTVRKHLSLVKGGQLAKMTKAKIISIIISDIIGNPIEFIASGPTAADSTTYSQAMKILKKYGIKNGEAIKVIKRGMKGEIEETPKKLENVENIVIADVKIACKYAKEIAEELGYYSKIICTELQGEAREVGRNLVEYAIYFPRNHSVLIAGGETTVTVRGKGRGGRNQEIVLAAIKKMTNEAIIFISCGTDGIDGNSPAAGAIADGYSYKKAKEKELDVNEYLDANNSYKFFEEIGDAIITGYTGTNVMDIQIMVKL
mgnify:CR=1 FL=1